MQRVLKKKTSQFSPLLSADGWFTIMKDVPPLHYTLKIESFSLLSKHIDLENGRYETKEFEAGGFKWRLALYPNGDKKRNGSDHISLYLVFSEDNKSSYNSEIKAKFTFLMYDHHIDKYTIIRDEKVKIFHGIINKEHGFPKLIPLDKFKDASNGFLVDDCCVFGVFIFVLDHQVGGEILTFIEKPIKGKLLWVVNDFSSVKLKDCLESNIYTVAGIKWRMEFYPKGYNVFHYVSVYLKFDDESKFFPGYKVLVEFDLILKSQIDGGKDKEYEEHGCVWLKSNVPYAGCRGFISHEELNDLNNVFLVQDRLVIEANIMTISTLTDNS